MLELANPFSLAMRWWGGQCRSGRSPGAPHPIEPGDVVVGWPVPELGNPGDSPSRQTGRFDDVDAGTGGRVPQRWAPLPIIPGNQGSTAAGAGAGYLIWPGEMVTEWLVSELGTSRVSFPSH